MLYYVIVIHWLNEEVRRSTDCRFFTSERSAKAFIAEFKRGLRLDVQELKASEDYKEAEKDNKKAMLLEASNHTFHLAKTETPKTKSQWVAEINRILN